MTTLRRALALLALCLLAGCDHDEYSIQMVPRDGALMRRLTVMRLDQETEAGKSGVKYVAFSEEKLKALSALYKSRLPSENPDIHVFEDSFQGSWRGELGS
jgi:hypothetical protein